MINITKSDSIILSKLDNARTGSCLQLESGKWKEENTEGEKDRWEKKNRKTEGNNHFNLFVCQPQRDVK